jgi:uncharacterized protein YggE
MTALRPLTALALVFAFAGAAAAPALAQTPVTISAAPVPTTFSLSATGETRIAPDMATINLGVNTDAPTAGEALRANATKMTAVIAALKKGGLTDKDIQTSNLSINPQYVYEQNVPPKLTGYQVSNQVTVTVRDLAKLGQAVDATVNAGANAAGGISLGLSDPSAAEDAARLSAVKALNAKADLYAKATGYRIVRLVNLSEGGGYAPAPQPYPVMAMMKREAADSTPVAGGELRVKIDLSGTFELTR